MPSNTFYNSPGSVAEFLSWTGGLEEGSRGIPSVQNSGPASIQITGTDEVLANLKKYMVELPDLVAGGLMDYAELIFQESQKEVPVDMTYQKTVGKSGRIGKRLKGGTLKQSGTIEKVEGDDFALEIGYHTPYAAIQHEDMTFHHTLPGAKAKYLEDPANRIAPQIVPGIVAKMDSYFTTGIPSMTGMKASTRASLGNLGGMYI